MVQAHEPEGVDYVFGYARPLAYPLRQFGGYIGDLIDDHPASMRTLAGELGISPGTLSGYRIGRYLPLDRASLGAIAELLAPTKKKAKEIRAELLRRWVADLLDAHLRGADVTLEEARRAIRDTAKARRRR